MAKNLYNLTAVTTVNDSDLLHVNQGSVSSDKKVTKQNLLKEVNSSITSLNNSLANSLLVGDAETVSVPLTTPGINVLDVSFIAPAKSGYTFVFWVPVSSTYRWSPIGVGGSRFYYYVGTTDTTASTGFIYPIYKKNA